MSAQIIPFAFNDTQVRVIERDGEPWFVAKDVAEVLGYSKPRNAVSAHCKGALKWGAPTNGGEQEITIIPERDVYRLVMRSKLPSAERFEEWVVGEVLPQIRKTGQYGQTPASLSGPQLMAAALIEADATMKEQAQQIEGMREDVTAFERIGKADGSLSVTEAAKALGVRQTDLFRWLSSNGWIYRRTGGKNWLGYQTKCNTGYLEHKCTTVIRGDGTEKVTEQVRVTPKGLARLAKLVPNAQQAQELPLDQAGAAQ